MSGRHVQIDEELFCDLVRYFWMDEENPDPEARTRIAAALDAKLDRIINRELYSMYKTAPTPEEREKARQEYLDRKGILTDFRW